MNDVKKGRGRPPVADRKESLTIRVTAQQREFLEQKAKAENKSISLVIGDIVDQFTVRRLD